MKDTIKTFEEYQKEAVKYKISLDKFLEEHPDTPKDVIELLAVAYDGLGLGEAGEVQGKIKKIIRDNGGLITKEAKYEIAKELGDTMYYIASMSDNLGMTLEDIATMSVEKIRDRYSRGVLRGSGDNR
jgi:NTP pyrophosphatase (non-canonical NTP hydrolase)